MIRAKLLHQTMRKVVASKRRKPRYGESSDPNRSGFQMSRSQDIESGEMIDVGVEDIAEFLREHGEPGDAEEPYTSGATGHTRAGYTIGDAGEGGA